MPSQATWAAGGWEALPLTPRGETMETISISKVCPDEINGRFIRAHGAIPEDAKDLCALLANQIEARSDGKAQVAGDVIIANGYSDHRQEARRYPNGHIERGGPRLSCCVEPYTPFVYPDGAMSTSGGYWFGCDATELALVGTRVKHFWTWGTRPESDGGVEFLARVHVWEYTDNEKIY